jgi:hypothetical protein
MGGQTEETATKKEPRVIDGPGRKKKSRKEKKKNRNKKPTNALEEPKGETVIQFDIKEEPVSQFDVKEEPFSLFDVKPEPVEHVDVKQELVEQVDVKEEPVDHVDNIQKIQAKEKTADENQNVPEWASQTSVR